MAFLGLGTNITPMLTDLVPHVLPRSLKLQQALEKEIYVIHSLSLFRTVCTAAITQFNRSHPYGRLTWHDPLKSGPVKYILDPPTDVPPRGLFGLSDSLILRGEGCLV
jgi:hypothetical protein